MAERADLVSKIHKNLNVYSGKLLQQARSLLFPLKSPSLGKPVFVIGCSRSGTTVVYRTLSHSNHLASLHKETHAWWSYLHSLSDNRWDSHALGSDTVDAALREIVRKHFYTLLGDQRFVDKANQNCFRVPFLHALFPDAFFVHVIRNGPDNISSLIHGWSKPEEYGTWSKDLPEEVRIDQGRYSRWCFFLFDGWRRYVDASIEEVCAQQWMAANRAVLDAFATVPPSQQIRIYYEDILSDPEAAFQSVFDRLELPFEREMSSWCASVLNNPTNAFSRPRIGKWREEQPERIARVLPIIEDMMQELGYNANS